MGRAGGEREGEELTRGAEWGHEPLVVASVSRRTPAPASGTQADEEPPHGDLVTVTRVFNSLEAEMLRGCLEAEGIPATLGDAQTDPDRHLADRRAGRHPRDGARALRGRRAPDRATPSSAATLEIDELPADSEPARARGRRRSGARLSGCRAAPGSVLALVVLAVVVF